MVVTLMVMVVAVATGIAVVVAAVAEAAMVLAVTVAVAAVMLTKAVAAVAIMVVAVATIPPPGQARIWGLEASIWLQEALANFRRPWPSSERPLSCQSLCVLQDFVPFGALKLFLRTQSFFRKLAQFLTNWLSS